MEIERDLSVREGRVTISSLFEGRRTPTSFIRLRGRWLEKLGWLSGMRIHVYARKDAIMLLRVPYKPEDFKDSSCPEAVTVSEPKHRVPTE